MKSIQLVLSKVSSVEVPVSKREWIVGLSGAVVCYGLILAAI
ncbi:MAG: hypothetical protein R3194_08885 [Limnobacter sp.]|nr:hypothetical protein [Limnobacter sp.]